MLPKLTHYPTSASPTLKHITLLGSTGSIGTQTLELIRLFPDRLKVAALTAGRNASLLIEQARLFRPEVVVIGDVSLLPQVTHALVGTGIRVLAGEAGLIEAATLAKTNLVVAAMVGYAGLKPTVAAIQAGKEIALANKETLVVAGALMQKLVQTHQVSILPIDSEHSAIFQCLVGEPLEQVESLILTASGGPFRNRPLDTFVHITKAEALKHPNWTMGAKITIDSATMMNKGLEVIEARWLFDVDPAQIQVLIHPQSIIHSMVLFKDGSTKAQLGVPDMKVPIQYALTFPDRWAAPHARLNWYEVAQLDFAPPDFNRFPCLALAFESLNIGGVTPAVLNAANEEAVALFLAEKIRFTDIPICIEQAIRQLGNGNEADLSALATIDLETRAFVQELKLPVLHSTL